MQGTWIERLRARIASTWDVLTGRAYAAYSAPDYSSEMQLRVTGLHFLGEFDAYWNSDQFVPHRDAEAFSYLRGARKAFAKELGL